MAYYLGKEREVDVVKAYRRYQQYLREHENTFPPGAFALATAEWYQNPSDHRCPHDGWLEYISISEIPAGDRTRKTSLNMRFVSAYHDGYIEFVYPNVFNYALVSSSVASGLGDWLYDEFRLSSEGHLVHEIEWAGSPKQKDSRWVIEAADVQFQWIPQIISEKQ